MSGDHAVQWPGWEVVGRIGTGNFGAVYEIQRNMFGRIEKAALKVISIPEKSEDVEELYSEGYDRESVSLHYRDYLEELVKEYALMLDMKGHTNVVYCDDLRYIQHEDGIGWTIYIKMELLTPLMKAVDNHYNEEQTIRVGIDICNALALCKNMGIVHRDIKPQNILMSKTFDYKLGDFGVAKASDKTSNGTKIGTYDYMAPEVYLCQPYGAAADLYSLGLVLYWMMNEKRTPFLPLPPQIPSISAKETARRRRFSGEALPRPVNGSDALWKIVQKTCAYSPQDRYGSAEELRAALVGLLAGTPPVVTPPVEVSTPEETDDNLTISAFHGPVPRQESAEASSADKAEEVPDDDLTLSVFHGPVPGGDSTEEPSAHMPDDDLTISAFHGPVPKQKPVTEDPAPAEDPAPVQSHTDPQSESANTPQPPVRRKKPHSKKRLPLLASVIMAAVVAMIIGCFIFQSQSTVTCETCEKNGHQWISATCTKPKTCSVCSATQGTALGHKWGKKTVTLVSVDLIYVGKSAENNASSLSESIYESYLSGDRTRESFIKLGQQRERWYSNVRFTQYEDIPAEQLTGALHTWCINPNRKAGDTSIISVLNSYYLAYFVDNHANVCCTRCGEAKS